MSACPTATIAPPRAAESLLGALGADPDFRDAVLGDLAEEFALRAAWDGAAAARRWYWREALRTAPHLLRLWALAARAADLRYVAGVVLSAYALAVVVVGLVLGPLLIGLLALLAVTPPVPAAGPAPGHPLVSAALLLFAAIGAGTGGHIAAALGRRAPLVCAVALGVAWSTFGLVGAAVAGPPPQGYGLTVALSVVVLLAAVAGGARRVCAVGLEGARAAPEA